ncbi:hypothetical protein scyTo_0023934, partial [Scyliorhinus torazame]|nr:hypothetical protein [Scyliorhinus torazame]
KVTPFKKVIPNIIFWSKIELETFYEVVDSHLVSRIITLILTLKDVNSEDVDEIESYHSEW